MIVVGFKRRLPRKNSIIDIENCLRKISIYQMNITSFLIVERFPISNTWTDIFTRD